MLQHDVRMKVSPSYMTMLRVFFGYKDGFNEIETIKRIVIPALWLSKKMRLEAPFRLLLPSLFSSCLYNLSPSFLSYLNSKGH